MLKPLNPSAVTFRSITDSVRQTPYEQNDTTCTPATDLDESRPHRRVVSQVQAMTESRISSHECYIVSISLSALVSTPRTANICRERVIYLGLSRKLAQLWAVARKGTPIIAA